MPYLVPRPNSKLTIHDFTGNFSFDLRTEQSPDKWERITIHPNCDTMLLAEVIHIFKRNPEMFRRA